MTLQEEIVGDKTFRKGMDKILQSLKQLPPTRERNLSITKIQEAVMWLGMDLKRINEAGGPVENPYPNSKDPSNTVIEPTADNLKL